MEFMFRGENYTSDVSETEGNRASYIGCDGRATTKCERRMNEGEQDSDVMVLITIFYHTKSKPDLLLL